MVMENTEGRNKDSKSKRKVVQTSETDEGDDSSVASGSEEQNDQLELNAAHPVYSNEVTMYENLKWQDEAVQENENEVEKDANKKSNWKKVPVESKTKTLQREGSKYSIVFSMLILMFCILAGIKYFDPSLTDNIDAESMVKQLSKDFQNQSPYTLQKLKGRVFAYTQHKTSPQPFVLLVASTQDNHLTAECFAKRVAKLLTNHCVTINGSNYLDTTSNDAKLAIDAHLRGVFREGKFPTAAVIYNLDLIPYGTTTLFYAYCDHDNPMYKEAAIIFTITLPQGYQINDNEHDREELVEKYLSKDSLWVKDNQFSTEVMGALISRITDTVIVINKEESLEKSC